MKQTHGNSLVAGSHQAYNPLEVLEWEESNVQQSLRDVGNLSNHVQNRPDNPCQSVYVHTKICHHLGRNKGGLGQDQNKTQLKMKSDARVPCDKDLILRGLGMEDVVYVRVHR